MKNKILLALLSLTLSGCASLDSDVEKSKSRDKTMERMAKIALINEMLQSPDPTVRLEGARIAKEFVNEKKSIFGF